MRALTLMQPWATLVAIGAKQIETRSWYTFYAGPLAIHAAKSFPRTARLQCYYEPFVSTMKAYYTALGVPWNDDWWKTLPTGAVIGVGNLAGTFSVESLHPTELERAFGDYSPGRYGWLLEGMHPIKPVPVSGALGLWGFNYGD